MKKDSLLICLKSNVKDFKRIEIYIDEAKDVVMKRREDLDFKIKGIQQTYGEIVAKYEQAEKDIVRVKIEMERLEGAHDAIDTEMVFLVEGERLLERARADVKAGKKKSTILQKSVTIARDAFVEQRSRIETIEETFTKDFPSEAVYEFELDLEGISEFYRS